MKKFSKLFLIVASLSLIATGCSKIKTYGLVGTYSGGNIRMTVSSDGSVSFQNVGTDTASFSAVERALAKGFSDNMDNSDTLGSYLSGASTTLTPWDLTSEKTSYTFEITEKEVSAVDTSSGSYGQSSATAYGDVNYKFEFTKDQDTITCKVNLTISDAVKTFNNQYIDYSAGSTTPVSKSANNQIDGGEITFTK